MIHLYVYCIIYTVSQKLCTSPASCCHLRTVEKWRKVEATTRSFHLYMTSSSLGERGSSRNSMNFLWYSNHVNPPLICRRKYESAWIFKPEMCFFFPRVNYRCVYCIYLLYDYIITYLYTNYNKVSKLPAPAANCLIFWDWRNRPLTDRDVW